MNNKHFFTLLSLLIVVSVILTVSIMEDIRPLKIEIESSSCRVQDNSNYSHWCDYPCDGNIIEAGIKCQRSDDALVSNDGGEQDG